MTGFEVAGDDKAFHDAEAWTVGKNVVQMRCAAVKNPVAVRYCFRNFKLGDVHNSAGLPLVPFRTDNW
jgi:sialate O-acetylesterase